MEVRICIDVDDLERGIAFYVDGLGLKMNRRLGSDWAELTGASSPIDLLVNPPDPQPVASSPRTRTYERHWTPVHVDFVVTNIDAAVARALAAGAKLERPIQDRKWGRMANLADPFGHGLDLLEFQGRGYDAILQPEA